MNIIRVQLNDVYLKKTKELDDTFYNDKVLTFEWYKKRYDENHNTLLFIDNEEIVGYLVSIPIKKELYNTIVNGTITNVFVLNNRCI